MKVCPYCGEENRDEAKNCDYCRREIPSIKKQFLINFSVFGFLLIVLLLVLRLVINVL